MIKIKITKGGVATFIQPLTVKAAKNRLNREFEDCGLRSDVAAVAAHSLITETNRKVLAGETLFERC